MGIVRAAATLEEACQRLKTVLERPPSRPPADREVGNMALTAYLMAVAALARTESRGAHFRSDYPKRRDPGWKKHIVLQRGIDDGIRLTYVDVQ